MGHRDPLPQHSQPQHSQPRYRATLEERVAQTALEVCHAVLRGESYDEYLVTQMCLLFGANAGAGLTTWRLDGAVAADQVTVVAAGTAPVSAEQALRARDVAPTHPGVVAMLRTKTTHAIRVSDHTHLAKFWTTETWWRMHGYLDGRFPAGALLLDSPNVQIFMGMHRRDRDFTDADLAAFTALQRPIAAALAFRAALDDTVQLLRRRPSRGPADEPVAARRALEAAIGLCRDYTPTRREGEVLALAAQGWTNQQIGRRLGISERTVRKHLTAVYDKAGLRGRAAAAAWWQRRND